MTQPLHVTTSYDILCNLHSFCMQGARRGVRSAVMRLPLYVYDSTGSIFSRVQEDKAVQRGFATFFDEGELPASHSLCSCASCQLVPVMSSGRMSHKNGRQATQHLRLVAHACYLPHVSGNPACTGHNQDNVQPRGETFFSWAA